jgi:hypothetical protein
MDASTAVLACYNKADPAQDSIVVNALEAEGIKAVAIEAEKMPPGSIPDWVSKPPTAYAYVLVPAEQATAATPIVLRAIEAFRFPFESEG